MTVRTDITAVDIVELLRARGPSPASRLSTLLQQEGHGVTAAQLQPLLDELVDAGDVIAVLRPPRRWNDASAAHLVYELATDP